MTNVGFSSAPQTTAFRVTEYVREALVRGVKPWVQPYTDLPPPLPLRSTGEGYRGSNVPLLWAAALRDGFMSSSWYTFKQAQAAGARVRRGERGTSIIFYAPRGPRDAPSALDVNTPSDEERGAVLRTYIVFNADQLDGLPPTASADALSEIPSISSTADVAQLAVAQLARVPAHFVPSIRAFYRPATDTVHLPPCDAFISSAHYAATCAHELAHWTGHTLRLNRPFLSHRADPRAYAREELVAELAAAFLGAELGLPVAHLEDHSAYLHHWLQLVSDEPRAFLTAAAHAQTAADFIRQFMQSES